MGFHVEGGSADKTPAFFFNHCGYLPFGGIEIISMTEKRAWQMRCFVEQEAYSQGYRHGDEGAWNPFHKKLLFGEPYRLWAKLFERGQREALAKLEFCVPEPESFDDSFNVWPMVYDALDSLAGDFEASYQRLGIQQRSGLRGLIEALVGWFNSSEDTFVSAM